MSFAERLARGAFPVALEITPPQGTRDHVLLRRANFLAGTATAINVVSRPMRQSSLAASITLRAAGYNPAWHLVTRGRSREQLQRELLDAAAGSVNQVLVVRGDHEAADAPGAPTIRETISLARESMPEALLGATLNQYLPDRAAVLRNLLPKLHAGANYVQTQPVFDLETVRPLAEAVKSANPKVHVVAMVMPLLTPDAAARVGARLGITLRKDLAAVEAFAWQHFDETVAALAASPLVDGLAVMTFEMDPPASVGLRIVEALRKAGGNVPLAVE